MSEKQLQPESSGSFENEPSVFSTIIHSLPSNSESEGLQALLNFDINAFDPVFCQDSYNNLGLPQPPSQDATIKKLREGQPPLKSFAFLQDANKGLGFVLQSRAHPSSSIVITTTAYLKMLTFFSALHDANSEWARTLKKFQDNMERLRTSLQPVNLGPYLQFVNHGRSRYRKPLETYYELGFELVMYVYSDSKWTDARLPSIILRYASIPNYPIQKNVNLPAGSIRLFPQICCTLAENGIPFLQKQISQSKSYFTATALPPVAPSSSLVQDILAQATYSSGVQQTLARCGLMSPLSSSTDTDCKDENPKYSTPVLAATKSKTTSSNSSSSSKMKKKSAEAKQRSKPYDRT